MDMSRRKVGTYARSNRRVLVHDLFDVSASTQSKSQSGQDGASSSRASTPLSQVSEDIAPSQQLAHELATAAQDLPHSTLRNASQHDQSRSPSPGTSPVYNLDCSSDEMKARTSEQTVKRRKLAPKTANTKFRDAKLPKAAQTTDDEITAKSTTVSPGPEVTHGHKAKKLPKKRSQNRAPQQPDIISHLGMTEDDHLSLLTSELSPSDIGSPETDSSLEPARSRTSTPKRKRDLQEDLSGDISSPSKLAISSLRLSPDTRSRSRPRPRDQSEIDLKAPLPSNGKTRFVDKLNGPTSAPPATTSGQQSLPTHQKMQRPASASLDRHPDLMDGADIVKPPRSTRGDRTQIDHQGPKRRMYGKKRSHLKSAVSGTSSQEQSSSQQSLQELVSQVESLTASKSPFDFEDDSEGEDSAPKLQSIHTLRHAGVTSRYERELDVLVEDLESDRNTLRISSLMSLVRKLQESKFKSYLLTSSKLSNVLSLMQPTLDTLSLAVLLLAVWTLASAESATSHGLTDIYDSLLRLPSDVFTESRSIGKIASDRTEHLSKSLVRDLVDFEQHVLNSSISQGGASGHIFVSPLALRCLDLSLRRLYALAAQIRDPPTAIVQVVLTSLKNNLDILEEQSSRTDIVKSITCILSWIEITVGASSDITDFMSPRLLEQFGSSLGRLLEWSRNKSTQIQQSSIRCAVNASNENLAVCEEFARTPLLTSMIDLVCEHFGMFTKDANTPENDSALAPVILALGGLLNFVDSSDTIRKQIVYEGTSDSDHVSRLVDIFNEHGDEISEATSSERGHALVVPLGYVSLILCTLCLEPIARARIGAAVKGEGLSQLVNAAEACLVFYRITELDSSGDNFVERFGTTVAAIKGDTSV